MYIKVNDIVIELSENLGKVIYIEPTTKQNLFKTIFTTTTFGVVYEKGIVIFKIRLLGKFISKKIYEFDKTHILEQYELDSIQYYDWLNGKLEFRLSYNINEDNKTHKKFVNESLKSYLNF